MQMGRDCRTSAAVVQGGIPIRSWSSRFARLLALAGLAACGAATGAPAGQVIATARVAPAPPAPMHRPLRDNAPIDLTTPTEPTMFAGYPQAPRFTIVPQKPGLTLHPCSACHAALPPNPKPRPLAAPHVASLPHGNGRFWCLDCHDERDRDRLRGLRGQAIDFDDSYLVCGQCHFRQQKDWYFGAHGKRVANWQGERQLYSCAHCHDPHDPALRPRAPGPRPRLRAGLEPMPAREPKR